MTLKIPNDRPLTEDERRYLLMRGEDARVKAQDERFPAEEDVEEDVDAEDDGEDGDDYDSWTVAELTQQIELRNTDGANIRPSGTKKQNLIDALREDDATRGTQ